ncbi:DUF1345 domain-containing protein [Gryllotalpicola protaetiae]|uniref:DUF1345 domain-containing protein n=2 Tax=Gryllotalpicola protaetiae TaxID=2419771 RepID=A0A387BW99_9MICO|nr:DUF1345 domain-containing protein [Gryllotalpicola protaetiae]
MLAAGVVAAVVTGLVSSWWYAGVVGWIVASTTYVAWVWIHLWPLDPDGMRSHATREDPGIVISDLLIIGAAVVSLAAVALILIRAAHDPVGQRAAIGGVSVLSVALSWFLIHTLYAQRYAREFYKDPPGGIDFPTQDGSTDDTPVFSDFAYVSFDLGMTYQISDTAVRTVRLRRIVLRHTLLSYLFGTVILASTINLVVGLGTS